MTKYTLQNQKKFKSYAPNKWVINPIRNKYDSDFNKDKVMLFRIRDFLKEQANNYYKLNNEYENIVIKKVTKKQNKPSINFKKYKNKCALIVKK